MIYHISFQISFLVVLKLLRKEKFDVRSLYTISQFPERICLENLIKDQLKAPSLWRSFFKF